ncbi:hypothetical protein AIG44_24610 [Salmonella enterica subsp. enterica serovar Bredeney]|nr:hypothetical protein [Salmonella enterica subsp. enterica serovar Bredeney]
MFLQLVGDTVLKDYLIPVCYEKHIRGWWECNNKSIMRLMIFYWVTLLFPFFGAQVICDK